VSPARAAAAACVISLGLLAGPVTATADTTAPQTFGTARAASLVVQISPQALLALPKQVLDAIPPDPTGLGVADILRRGLTGTLDIELDASSVRASLDRARTDLTGGSAESTALKLDLGALTPLLDNLRTVLGRLVPAAPALQGVQTLQSQLAAVGQQLGLAVDNPIKALLAGLADRVKLNKTLSAALDPSHPHGASVVSDLIDLSGIPVSGQLAPFRATAVDSVGAGTSKVSGPQASADNDTTVLTVGAGPLKLGSLDLNNLNALIGSLQGLIGSLAQTVTAITAAPSGTPLGTILANPALAALPSNPITSQLGALPVPQATQQINGTIGQLTGLLSSLKALTGLNLGSIDLPSLLKTHGVTSTALVEPKSTSGGSGVHAVATSKFLDISVLNLLGSLLPASAGTGMNPSAPLLELDAVTSVAEAFANGADTSAPTASSQIGGIKVLGQPVPVPDLPASTVQAIGSDEIGYLTVSITRATSGHVVNNDVNRKTVDIAPLEIRLLNGNFAAGRTGDHPLLAAVTGGAGGDIVRVSVVPAAVDAGVNAIPPQTSSPPPQNAVTPKTGLFGPGAFLIGGGVLGVAAAALHIVPALGARRRRRD
jgi:hypothetical protein